MREGLDYLKLPSAIKCGPGDYQPRSLRLDAERFRAMRTGLIREAADGFRPHLALIDKTPLGLMGELGAALMKLREMETRLVLGWRDILDGPSSVHPEWRRQGPLDIVERTYGE